MPKKRKHGYDDEEDDDEEYRTSDDGDGNSKEDDDDDFVEKPTKKKPSAPSNKPFDVVDLLRRKKRQQSRKNDDDLSDDDDYDGDTTARMTENGGYAHTHTSKLRISKANKGNTPWNKGGQRSAADKAKISEGVRARNRAILLEKLELLGLTEDEWLVKKKQIKYLREKVRKAKKANQLKEVAEQEKMLNAALAETTVENEGKKRKKKKAKPVDTENKYAKKVMMAKVKQGKPSVATTTEPDAELKNGSKKRKKQKESAAVVPDGVSSTVAAAIPGVNLPAIFARDISWTYHPFDSSESDSPYDSTCPKGGPGGLICCEACTKNYSNFLTTTSKDMEEQKTQKVNNEVQELLGILTSAKSKLNNALRAAKQQSGKGIRSRGDTTSTRQRKPPPKKAPPKSTQPEALTPPEQQPGELPQLPEFSFQFTDCPPTLPPITADVATLPPMQNFELESEGIDASTQPVAV